MLPEGSTVTYGTLRFDYCSHKRPNDEVASIYYFKSLKVTVSHVDGKYRFQGEGVQYNAWDDEMIPLSKLVFDITADIPSLPIM